MIAPKQGPENKLRGMKESAEYLGISRSQIYVLEKRDPDFPNRFPVGRRRYLTTLQLDNYVEKKGALIG